uniref:NADH-ubiquinone oxidoreductase chain 2 n=1 Tax=Eurycantha calcarata TaxID=93610 RepID=A0A8E5K099_9NEOP|nr:NADH dehydrogenase subunit 2 [Eurycantha calcarata]QVD43184.1 NADH dehydrogenase subunit 2 [Eurycantha calcarata]
MINKSTNLVFILMLMLSVLISISSNSWFTVWMGMEINMMAFIPIILEKKNMMSKEATLTYFMTQTIASMLLMLSIIMMKMAILININSPLMMSALMMKSGISPFHFWMPKVMEGLNWTNCLILMTLQKITPLLMMSMIIKMNFMMITSMLLSVMVGAIGGINQTSLRKLMAYSSISNNGWMLVAMNYSEILWINYFIMYIIMSVIMTMSMNKYKVFTMNQLMSMNEKLSMKIMLFINMLSISGLPPMMGFLPKWMVIQYSMMNNSLMLMMSLIMMTLITVYYYLRIMYSTMLLTNLNPKWSLMINKKNYIIMTTSMMSIIGLTMVSMILSLY